MTTSSDGPGSAPVLQLDGVSQSPPLGLIQVTVEKQGPVFEPEDRRAEGPWRSLGRSPRREVRDDRRDVRRSGCFLR